jgi:hypothetical protein
MDGSEVVMSGVSKEKMSIILVMNVHKNSRKRNHV